MRFNIIYISHASFYCDVFEKLVRLVSSTKILLVAASFCICQVHSEKKVGYHSEIRIESPCKNECKKYCLNGGESFYLVDQDTLGCNCIWLYAGECCENEMW